MAHCGRLLRSLRPAMLLVLVLFVPLLFPQFSALATPPPSSWGVILSERPAMPKRFIAVDKSRQTLALFEKHNPLRQTQAFFCSTGKVVGDKQVEGDLKTPEGVYFVQRHINSGLNFIKYGYEAFTLNYPNPVDRLRKKTGYGIWIHGRGEPLKPLQTSGCLSLDNNDLACIREELTPGTPIVSAASFSFEEANAREKTNTSILVQNVHNWISAWAERSSSFFDFYDKKAYSLAQGKQFSSFQVQQEVLFKKLPWIKIAVDDIHVLSGPGYWVTWFRQDYRAPNKTMSGTRRLYWMGSPETGFKIVGMEWEQDADTGVLLASKDSDLPPAKTAPRTKNKPIDRTPRRKVLTNIPPLNASSRRAINKQVALHARQTEVLPAAVLTAAWAKRSRKTVEAFYPTENSFEPLSADAAHTNSAPLQKRKPGWYVKDSRDLHWDESASVVAVQTSPMEEPPVVAPVKSKSVAISVEPVSNDGGGSGSLDTPDGTDTARLLLSLWETGQVATPEENTDAASAQQLDRAQVAWAKDPHKAGESTSIDKNLTTYTPGGWGKKLAGTKATLVAQLENWRAAWESGAIDKYLEFYTPDARQKDISGIKTIRAQKQDLWSKVAPARVHLSNVHVRAEGSRIFVTMLQVYFNGNGWSDTGIKSLAFEEHDGVLLIAQEDWSPISNEVSY